MPSEHVENYLKSIYSLQDDDGLVTTSSLSERLQVSAASVSEMIKKLADEGSVIHTPYKGVELTLAGRRRAIQIIRRHRLWELFLVEVLKYEWDEIHEEAERLEHITSEKLEKRIDAALGYPQTDPHGDVIPTAEGVVVHFGHTSLGAAKDGQRCVVCRVSDVHPDVLKYAKNLGLSLRKEILVKEHIEFDGSLRIEVDGAEHFISAKLAQHVFVKPISEAGDRKTPASKNKRKPNKSSSKGGR